MKRNKTLEIATGGIIAALYVALTFVAQAFGMASGAIQLRLSEALTILPCFTVSAVLANLLTGCAPWDVVFGSLATLIGAVGTRMMKNHIGWAWIPPVLSNAVIIPFVLQRVYGVPDAWWFLALTVGAGELVACGLLGILVAKAAERVPQLNGERT